MPVASWMQPSTCLCAFRHHHAGCPLESELGGALFDRKRRPMGTPRLVSKRRALFYYRANAVEAENWPVCSVRRCTKSSSRGESLNSFGSCRSVRSGWKKIPVSEELGLALPSRFQPLPGRPWSLPKPLEFPHRPSKKILIDALRNEVQRRAVERSVIVDPAPHLRVNLASETG